MRAVLTVEMDGAAFDGRALGPELARILLLASNWMLQEDRETVLHYDGTVLLDINGNKVGELRIEEEEDVPDTPRLLRCDMHDACKAPVTHMDNRGFIYCETHGVARRQGGTPCRKLRPAELRKVEKGESISYLRS